MTALLRYREVEPDAAGGRPPYTPSGGRWGSSWPSPGTRPTRSGTRDNTNEPRGEKRAAFFIPHENETGYWWQGENARLASLAAAAWRASAGDDPAARARWPLRGRPADWILGLNPFDACMLQGRGRNNPDDLPGYPDAPGGICNGVTAGFADPRDIAFLPPEYADDPSHNWRWSEQWLPHDAWMFLALAAMDAALR